MSALNRVHENIQEEVIYRRSNLNESPSGRLDVGNFTFINTEYGNFKELCRVACVRDEYLWTCGQDNIIRLYDFQGNLVLPIRTLSGNWPWDITVTRSGDLIYTDPNKRTVNLLHNTQIQEIIRICEWKPRGICATLSDDILVIMDHDDKIQSKVVRFSGSTERRSYQFTKRDRNLYSPGLIKYICENKNQDICVVDCEAHSVVAIKKAGLFRFRYNVARSLQERPSLLVGIATDSQSRILTSDFLNHVIIILDKDGQFLRNIDTSLKIVPWGLCVDSKENLFVTEFNTGKIMKIEIPQ